MADSGDIDDVTKQKLSKAMRCSPLANEMMNAILTTAGEDKGEKETRAAMERVLGGEKLTPEDVGSLYKFLVRGLVVTMVGALAALTVTILDANDATSPDLLLTVFTGTLGGLVGLFSRSPGR